MIWSVYAAELLFLVTLRNEIDVNATMWDEIPGWEAPQKISLKKTIFEEERAFWSSELLSQFSYRFSVFPDNFTSIYTKKSKKFGWFQKKLWQPKVGHRKFLRSKIFDFHFHTIFNEFFWDQKFRNFSISKFSKIFIENCMKMKIEIFRSQKFSSSNFKLS